MSIKPKRAPLPRDMEPKPELATWSERRPVRNEAERKQIAEDYAKQADLPVIGMGNIAQAELEAAKAAFIKRFDEDLPRTETLLAVMAVGYAMAVRDLVQ